MGRGCDFCHDDSCDGQEPHSCHDVLCSHRATPAPAWQKDWPTDGFWWAWHPEIMSPPEPISAYADSLNMLGSDTPVYGTSDWHDSDNDGRWRFLPLEVPAPPKEHE